MFGYEIRTAFMVLLLAQNIFGDTPSASQSNSSIAPAKSGTEPSSHGSKLLQSAPLIANHPQHQLLSHEPATSENFTNIVRLEDVLVLFDLDGLATNWPKIRHELRSNCQHDINEYLRGLKQHKMWAIKSKLPSHYDSNRVWFFFCIVCAWFSLHFWVWVISCRCVSVEVVSFIANFVRMKWNRKQMNARKSSAIMKLKRNEQKPPSTFFSGKISVPSRCVSVSVDIFVIVK